MTAPADLLAELEPILERISRLDPGNPAEAEAVLGAMNTHRLEELARAAHAEGWLTPREGGGVRFGRLAKASPATAGLSVDVVDMDGPASGPHTHVTGEFDLAFSLAGPARFDGRASRWIVYPPGSRHVPTVTGGRMLVFYFLPGGEIRFEPTA